MAYAVARIVNHKMYFVVEHIEDKRAVVWTSQVKDAAQFSSHRLAERFLVTKLNNRPDALVITTS